MHQLPETPPQALASLYGDYHQQIVRYLTRISGSREMAEDLAQETFLKALRHWNHLLTTEGRVAWLFRIARNTAYDEHRRQRRSRTSPFTDAQRDALAGRDTTPEITELEAVRAALDHLPEPARVALLLHSYAGYPLDAVAAAMGWKVGTVKSRLSRARAQFRKHYAA